MLRGKGVVHTQYDGIGAFGNVATNTVILIDTAYGKSPAMKKQDCRSQPRSILGAITSHQNRGVCCHRHLVIHHYRHGTLRHVQQGNHVTIELARLRHRDTV